MDTIGGQVNEIQKTDRLKENGNAANKAYAIMLPFMANKDMNKKELHFVE